MTPIENVPLTIFPLLLLALAALLFIFVAGFPNGTPESGVTRQRLIGAGLACYMVYQVLQLIGGLVRTP